jgi:hypothetical protein
MGYNVASFSNWDNRYRFCLLPGLGNSGRTNRTVRLPTAEGPVIDAKHARCARYRRRRPQQTPKEHMWASRHPQLTSGPSSAFPAAGEADGGQCVVQTKRRASAHGSEPF